MKPFIFIFVLGVINSSPSAQSDTLTQALKDSAQVRINIFENHFQTVAKNYYLYYPLDTMRNKIRMYSFPYNATFYEPSTNKFLNIAGPVLLSIIADKTKHQYFYYPPR